MRRPHRRAALALLAAPWLAAAAPPAGPGGPREAAYGLHPRQKLDVYARKGLKGAPVLAYVHGGGWGAGGRRDVFGLPDLAAGAGALLVSVGHRLAPETDARGCAEDVADAAAWTMRHARSFGGDPKRVFLLGHSSGAHLAALVAVDPAYLKRRARRPSDLAGMIGLDSASYDPAAEMTRLRTLGAEQSPVGQMYARAFGAAPGLLSPARRVRSNLRLPPFLLFHTAEATGTREQTRAFAKVLRAAGARAETVEAAADTHMGLLRDIGLAGDPEGTRIARFLKTGFA